MSRSSPSDGSAHWAIVLQPGKVPVKKRLPKYAADQVPMLRELITAYPTGLLAVVDACGGEIVVWHPKEVEAMAGLMEQNAKLRDAGESGVEQH